MSSVRAYREGRGPVFTKEFETVAEAEKYAADFVERNAVENWTLNVDPTEEGLSVALTLGTEQAAVDAGIADKFEGSRIHVLGVRDTIASPEVAEKVTRLVEENFGPFDFAGESYMLSKSECEKHAAQLKEMGF